MFLLHREYWSILTGLRNPVLTVFFVSLCLAFFSFVLYLNCMMQILEGWSCDPRVLRVLCMFTGFLCSAVNLERRVFLERIVDNQQWPCYHGDKGAWRGWADLRQVISPSASFRLHAWPCDPALCGASAALQWWHDVISIAFIILR